MDGESMNVVDEKLRQLKILLPEAFTEGKIDWFIYLISIPVKIFKKK